MNTTIDPAQQAWALMHQFVEAHNRRGELADTIGLRLGAGRGKFLFALRDGPRTLGQLAEINGTDAPYATLIVDKLENHGLVTRQIDPQDRRRKLVRLTSAGREAVETANTILLRPPSAIAALTTNDLMQLTELLTRLLQVDSPEPTEEPTPGTFHRTSTKSR